MIILAIDPGSFCGWAVRTPDGAYASGVWDLTPPRGSSPGVRYLYLRARLNEIRVAYPDLALVAYEQAHQRGGAATEYAVGCATHIMSWCAAYGVEHHKVHSSTVKRVALGSGRGSKQDIVAAARARWGGWTPANDDEADARWIADAAWKELGDA